MTDKKTVSIGELASFTRQVMKDVIRTMIDRGYEYANDNSDTLSTFRKTAIIHDMEAWQISAIQETLKDIRSQKTKKYDTLVDKIAYAIYTYKLR